jgi:hypothetical protein
MKPNPNKIQFIKREYDNVWQIVVPASVVRLGITDKELVKQGKAVDLAKWITVFSGKSHKELTKWLDTNKQNVLKIMTLYEVSY